jgi:SAM-dependent methyltransferase
VTEPRTLVGLEKRFDRLVSCDTLEHVRDADAYFRGLAQLMAPGGRFLVTFPNEPKNRMHGITRFDSPEQLAACVKRAGFVDVRISTVKLTPDAERVAQTLGWKPLEMVRSFTRRAPKQADAAIGAPPQTFEQTSFFKRRALYKRIAPVVNLYWFGVLRAMERGGPSFEVDEKFRREPFEDGQVMILGSLPAAS